MTLSSRFPTSVTSDSAPSAGDGGLDALPSSARPTYAPPRFVRFLVVGAALTLHLGAARHAFTQCESLGPGGPAPNVLWGFKDSVAACPAGDSLIGSSRPARLRITVYYYDPDDCPRVGVPPESIWVQVSIVAGNLKVNDVGLKTFADDATDANGFARITLPSFSGCGKVAVNLRVSGISQGTKHATVRSTDPDGDGRMEASESALVCDLNYSDPYGIGGTEDQQIAIPHIDHWHRHALHGTLVKRTTLCDSCPIGDPNTIGDGKIAWSPNGRWLSFDIDDPDIGCKVFLAPSDPAQGNTLTQFTFPTSPDSADYDASWSPLGDEIVFARRDRVIYRKPVPWLGSSEIAVFGDAFNLITYPAISPDGKVIAFVRLESGGSHIYTVSATGGTLKQITSGTVIDRYPEWSPDGRLLIFERRTPGQVHLYKVAPSDDVPSAVPFYTPTNAAAILPSYSPDSLAIIAGVGPLATPVAATLETAPPGTPLAITTNYPAHTFSLLSPRISPQGTRLAVIAKNPAIAGAVSPQVWAARQNMSLPPKFTRVDGQSLHDTTAKVSVNAIVGLTRTITLEATDSEQDILTYAASFLQPGMTFAPATRTLTWPDVPAPPGVKYHVKFWVTTPSGGTDAVIAEILTVSGFSADARDPRSVQTEGSALSSHAAAGRFSITAPHPSGGVARLTVFDLAGRRLGVVRGPARSELIWEGTDPTGAPVPTGIYFYFLETGDTRRSGRFVLLR